MKKSAKSRSGFTFLEMVFSLILIGCVVAVAFILLDATNRPDKAPVTKTSVLSDKEIEQKHGFSASVFDGVLPSKMEVTKGSEMEGTNVYHLTIDMKEAKFTFGGSTNTEGKSKTKKND